MFVIFRNGSEERIINTDQINAIWEDKSSKQPRFHVEYFGGGFGFNSLYWNGFNRGVVTLGDVWLALRYFEKLNILYDPKEELRRANATSR